jgi:hypothetical protein
LNCEDIDSVFDVEQTFFKTDNSKNILWNGRHITNCSNKDDSKKKESSGNHFDRGREALIEAMAHSAAAGLAIEVCPPIAIYEGYKAVESWKEAAREYNEGFEARKKNGD